MPGILSILFRHTSCLTSQPCLCSPAQVARLRVRHLARALDRRVEGTMLGPGLCRALFASLLRIQTAQRRR